MLSDVCRLTMKCNHPGQEGKHSSPLPQTLAIKNGDGLAVDANQAFVAHLVEDARQGLRAGAEQAGQLPLGDVEHHLILPLLLFHQVLQVGGEPSRDLFEGEVFHLGGETA